MSTVKRFRKCVDPCQRYLTPDDEHDLCVMCLGEEHPRSVLEGTECVHCEHFSLRKLRSHLSRFSRELGQSSAPRDSAVSAVSAAAKAARRLRSWGSQMEFADEIERCVNLSLPSADDESELRGEDVLSLTSSDPAGSALLASGQSEQDLADEGEDGAFEPSQPACPTYGELMEVMNRATARLDLQWRHEKGEIAHGRLDERFLSEHNRPVPVSLPFLPDLHSEIERVWDKPYSARIHRYQHTNYANIEGMREHGYPSMPPIEETLASYLLAGVTSTLKAPALPSKPLRETSHLNGRAYAAAGQAGAALHTMSVLQAYQADLLRDLDQGQGISPEGVAELSRATDTTKQTAAAIGRSMAAMVATERHLWVNLADIG